MKKLSFITLACVAAFALASCDKESEVIPQSGVTLDSSEITLGIGEYAELGAKINPSNATSNYLKWASSDTKVATVTGHGQVIAVGANTSKIGNGTATITATTVDGNQVASCKVNVKPVRATGVSINKSSVEVDVRDSVKIEALVAPKSAVALASPDSKSATYNTNKWLKWSSSDPAVAVVDNNGTAWEQDKTTVSVKGIKEGTATITVETLDGGYKATTQVTVKAPAVIDNWVNDSASSIEFKMGGDADVKNAAGWLKYDAKTKTVSWTENTTGAVRSDTLRMKGAMAVITQISENDFGTWTLRAKLFDPNKSAGKGNTNACETSVTIAGKAGENGNNITIKGLYKEAAVEGKLDIDYSAKTYKLGVYLSKTLVYDAGNGAYCVLLPECASAASGSYWTGYNFCPAADNAFSSTNSDWLWFEQVDGSADKLKYQYYGAGQISENGKYRYCGLSFVKASATAITGTSYDVIYQANYNGSNPESMYFKK